MLQRNADSSEGLPLCSRGIITPSFYYQQLAADVHSLLQVRFKFSFVLDLHPADDDSQLQFGESFSVIGSRDKFELVITR